MPTVDIRVDVGGADGLPHAFIVITDSDGVETGHGFAPAQAGSLFGPGQIYDDYFHEYQFSTGPTPITNQQLQDLQDFITGSQESPPYYSVPGEWVPPLDNHNCSTWIIDALNTAGIPDVFGVSSSWAWNPYGQAISVGVIDLWNQLTDWSIDLLGIDDTFTPPPSDLGTPPPTPGSPIVLDLDGDGIETVGLSADIHFDHDGDGFKELSGFTNADDGLLALDRNNDGVINNGSELFGSFTELDDGSLAQNGFEALKEFDLNADGVINSDDAIYSDLRVFNDLDQDGQTDAGELLTLTEAGVESLALDYTNQTYIDAAGNDHRQVGSYTNASGEVLGATDVWFARNLTDTEETSIDVSAEIAALPDAVEVDCFFSKAAA